MSNINIKGESMMLKKMRVLNLVLGLSLFSSINALSGTVDNDINFTTHNGESNSLYEILNSGKHIFLGVYTYAG